jgi:cytochrome P450
MRTHWSRYAQRHFAGRSPVGGPLEVFDFDPFSEEYANNTTETNKRLRDDPVTYWDHYGGFWCVARHADVVEAFKHDGKELSARHEMLEDGLQLRGVLMPPSPTHLGRGLPRGNLRPG